MQHLKLNNLSFSYNDIELFSSISLDFTSSWYAIVGQNGSGKTTLLRLIAKELKLQIGTIQTKGFIYYCEQKLDVLPNGFEEFREDYTSKKFRLLELLNIKDEWLYRWDTLSFGEKKRIQVAIALYMDVDILLLDEPTNHLDISSKMIVIKALESFKGIGLIVSHDRVLLDTLCRNTIIIKNKKLYQYATNYTNAKIEFEKQIFAIQKIAQRQDQKIKSLEKNIQSQKEKVSKSKAKLSKRNIDKKDKSLKEKINLAKLTGKDKSDSKKVDTLNSKLNQIKKIDIDKEYKKGIVLENKKERNSIFPIFLKADILKINQDKSVSFEDINIKSNDRIAIIGDNGVGKSSFINYFVSKLKEEDILYIPQEIDIKSSQKLFEDIDNMSDGKKGKLYTIITRLSSNPKNLLGNSTPSSGELRKLLIAKAMLDGIAFIILDEPTNHMDMDSIISLEVALKNFNGAILFVSHDMVFIDKIASSIWKIEDGKLNITP